MATTKEATGNKAHDLSYVHGVGMAQGLTQQGLVFIDMAEMAKEFIAIQAKPETVIEAQLADNQLRDIAQSTENFKSLDDTQKSEVTKLFGNLFYQTQLFHPAIEDISIEKVAEGISDFAEQGSVPSEEMIKEYTAVMEVYQEKAEEEQNATAKIAGEAGYTFLQENAKKEGVQVTESGLQYEIIQAGEGQCPTAENEVTVHYEGTTIEGKIFDSSVQRGEKISFGLSQVIKGWTEGLQLMNTGAKFKFYIPQELAYGAQGAGADIAPYAALIFTVELFSFK
ncbi:MAG: FKBP-type peptidyl-prolyl cis-trans isomerase FklB [Saprospiraceae bacterium]|jgi:FKBP-type peptidyl-prolyl cis-trans isomerase FklB